MPCHAIASVGVWMVRREETMLHADCIVLLFARVFFFPRDKRTMAAIPSVEEMRNTLMQLGDGDLHARCTYVMSVKAALAAHGVDQQLKAYNLAFARIGRRLTEVVGHTVLRADIRRAMRGQAPEVPLAAAWKDELVKFEVADEIINVRKYVGMMMAHLRRRYTSNDNASAPPTIADIERTHLLDNTPSIIMEDDMDTSEPSTTNHHALVPRDGAQQHEWLNHRQVPTWADVVKKRTLDPVVAFS